MKMDKISIIVSAYNTEQYVSKCLDSLLQQTYSNLEIILIDDGSTDETLKVLKKYEKQDKRIILFSNEKNKGLAYSRNRGLKKASGKYVGFVDSDDVIDLDYYEKMMQSVKEQHSLVSVSDIKSVYEKDGSIFLQKGCEGDPKDKLSYVNVGLAASACNKLFLKELFGEDPFAVGRINEDVAVIIPILVKANKISYVKDTYYYYIQREYSIQNSEFSESRFDIFVGLEHTLDKIKDQDSFEIYQDALVFQQIILLLLYQFPNIINRKERKRFLKKFYSLSKKYDILKNSFLPSFLGGNGPKMRIFYRLFLFFTYHRFFFLSNSLLSFYQFLKRKFQTVVMNDSSMEELILLAQKNQNLDHNVPKISVVIPNYNYAKFLNQRLVSILKQRVYIHEILILDDCSTDQSQELIDQFVELLNPYINIQKIYNFKNSGSPFKQWEKGFDLASGDYVWICEADDYCNEHLLFTLVKPITKNLDVVISYCDTAMIDVHGKVLVSSVRKDIDLLKTGHWNSNYVNDGKAEILDYAYLNCTIANVSSALIRKGSYQEYFQNAGRYRQAGDWLFYLLVMQEGLVAYSKKVCNYYRIHGSNVTSITKKQAHFQEVKQIHEYILSHYKISKEKKENIKERQLYLIDVWNLEK